MACWFGKLSSSLSEPLGLIHTAYRSTACGEMVATPILYLPSGGAVMRLLRIMPVTQNGDLPSACAPMLTLFGALFTLLRVCQTLPGAMSACAWLMTACAECRKGVLCMAQLLSQSGWNCSCAERQHPAFFGQTTALLIWVRGCVCCSCVCMTVLNWHLSICRVVCSCWPVCCRFLCLHSLAFLSSVLSSHIRVTWMVVALVRPARTLSAAVLTVTNGMWAFIRVVLLHRHATVPLAAQL